MRNRRWDASCIARQDGRIAIVTGGNSGIGFEIAAVLAGKGAEVVLAVRDMHKGGAARADIRKAFPDALVQVMLLDLADLSSVRRFACAVLDRYSGLDLLINNAGVMAPPEKQVTVDGFELQFATNHLGHFALTLLLSGLLKRTSSSRVITVSSGAHYFGKLDMSDLNWQTRSYRKWQAYGDSKLANLYFTRQLQRRFAEDSASTIAVAAHPGWSATNLQRYVPRAMVFNRFFAQSSAMGALPELYAATAEDVAGGEYFGPRGFGGFRGYPIRCASSALSENRQLAERLWAVSEELTGIFWSRAAGSD